MSTSVNSSGYAYTKVIGLDIGRVRVGIATASFGVVTPFATLPRSQHRAEKAILDLIKEFKAELLVIGAPYYLAERHSSDLNSTEEIPTHINSSLNDVFNFSKRISKRSDIKIHFEDEYLSSVEAGSYLNKNSFLKIKPNNKLTDDAEAAAIILTRFFKHYL